MSQDQKRQGIWKRDVQKVLHYPLQLTQCNIVITFIITVVIIIMKIVIIIIIIMVSLLEYCILVS